MHFIMFDAYENYKKEGKLLVHAVYQDTCIWPHAFYVLKEYLTGFSITSTASKCIHVITYI